VVSAYMNTQPRSVRVVPQEKKMKTTAVNPTTQISPPAVVSDPEPRTFIGQVFHFIRELRLNPPKTRLERVSTPRCVSEERKQYLAFCNRAGIKPLPIRAVLSRDEKTYNDYAAYCTKIGIESPSRERWERCTRRSRMPSAIVASPICSCH
jgi:hypothetical protein